MKLRNVLTVLGTAAVTAALTLALFTPWGGDAQAGPAIQPVITQSQLESQGCTFTLKTDKTSYEAGQAPAVEVTASNPTDKPVTAPVLVTVTSTSPTSPCRACSRFPMTLWSHEYAFTLPPDATQVADRRLRGPARRKKRRNDPDRPAAERCPGGTRCCSAAGGAERRTKHRVVRGETEVGPRPCFPDSASCSAWRWAWRRLRHPGLLPPRPGRRGDRPARERVRRRPPPGRDPLRRRRR